MIPRLTSLTIFAAAQVRDRLASRWTWSSTPPTIEHDFAGILPNTSAQLELQKADVEVAVVETKAFGDLVGQSGALRRVVSQIDVVAPTEASVLIPG
jgi:transcriptional regulator with AAA-type ATPase domain